MATEDMNKEDLHAATAWFYLLGMFDAMSVPTRWVWDESDTAMNERFNALLGAESTGSTEEWKSEQARKPSEGADDTIWEPRYFPDEPYDLELARRKHELVMAGSIERKQLIEDVLIEKGTRLDADSLADALSNGRLLFSLVQYATISPWISERVTDFARAPKVRWMVYRMWTDAPLLGDPEDLERGQKMLQGGSVFAVSKATGEKLGRIMRGQY